MATLLTEIKSVWPRPMSRNTSTGLCSQTHGAGAVVGAAPKSNVVREKPVAGDLVILLGGKTGRDGVGGATGSSKVQTVESVETAGAEVQKGNAIEERKIQRLFRNGDVTRLIKNPMTLEPVVSVWPSVNWRMVWKLI